MPILVHINVKYFRSGGSLTPPRRMMFYFSLLGFFAIFSTTISKNPVLPLFVQALGADNTIIGLIAAFSPLAASCSPFPWGCFPIISGGSACS